jgi:hypothetical protein
MALIDTLIAEGTILNARSSVDTPFVYAALSPKAKEIRLLTLLPSPFNFPLRLTLHHENLDIQSPLAYEALSYVWGSQNSPVNIHVGFDGESLSVTQNLALALP